MKYLRAAFTVFMMVLMSARLSPNARADDWNRKTVITFGSPIEIPGVHFRGGGVLPAGSYVFKLLDSQSDRHIVQISDRNETIIYATILAVPSYRVKVTDKTVITFSERAVGQPEALRAWFYPGRTWGDEFVYPKAKAIESAKVASAPVPSTPVDIPTDVVTPIKSIGSGQTFNNSLNAAVTLSATLSLIGGGLLGLGMLLQKRFFRQ